MFRLAILCTVLHITAGQYFLTVPSDACVSPGDVVDFRCTTVYFLDPLLLPTQQEWVVTPTAGPVIEFSSFQTAPLPSGFSFIMDPDLSGIRVTATSNLNDATFQCIALRPSTLERNNTALAIATLQVAGEPSLFSCGLVSCPILYSPGVDNMCTVQWSAPWTVDCAPLTSYTITLMRRDNGEVVSSSSQSPSDSRIHDIIVLVPAKGYTVTISAVNVVGATNCVTEFMSPNEQSPDDFTLEFTVTAIDNIVIIPMFPNSTSRPSVTEYLVLVADEGQDVLGSWIFPGNSSSLSLDISSLQQCMSYTVSVTASNTGGNTTTNATLFLDPLTSLDVSCVAGEDGCYLEASCVSSQPGLVSGCRLDYTSGAGAALMNVTQLSSSSRIAVVSCDNQTISYTGTAYDSMLRALGCPRSGMAKCPPMKGQNGSQDSGRCSNDKVWFPLSLILLVYSALLTAATVALTLALWGKTHQKGGHRTAVPSHSTKEEVALKENLCYGPVASPPPPPPAAAQTVSEYEEIEAPPPRYM